MRASSAHLIKAAGSALAVGSLLFIAFLLWRERHALAGFRPDMADIAVLVLCMIAYAMLGLVLADAWRRLLIWLGEANVLAADTRRIYAQTQLAKYIPGNVAQFAGRQFVGRQASWTHSGLFLSTVFELLSLIAASAILASIAVVGGAYEAIGVDVWQASAIAVLLVVLVLLALRIAPRLLAGRWPEIAQRLAVLRVRDLWPVFAGHTLFFVLSGLILVAVTGVAMRAPVPYENWPALIGLFAVAWIVSTLTPGAPSGIGVRELVFVAGLSLTVPTGGTILAAALLRMVTVGGDLIFFACAGIGRAQSNFQAPD